jgi:structural maintenance of chromosomes protein 6
LKAEALRAIEKCEKSIKEHEAKIKDIRALENNGAERQRDQERLDILEAQIIEFTNRSLEIGKMKSDNSDKIKHIEAEQVNAKKRLLDSQTELRQEKVLLSELEKAKTDRLNAFHNNMPHVMNAINQKKNQFHQMPVGPLGMHVKLLKEEWANICERLFGKVLNGFLVVDHHDRELLQSILSQFRWYLPASMQFNRSDVPVIKSKRDLFDYRQGEPAEHFTTVLRILEVKYLSLTSLANHSSRMNLSSANSSIKIISSRQF